MIKGKKTSLIRVKNQTIRQKIVFAFSIMVGCMMLLNIFMLYSLHSFSAEYHQVATRIADANHLVPLVRTEISTESYYLTTGRNSLANTRLTEMLITVRSTIDKLNSTTVKDNSRSQLKISGKVMNTLDRYTGKLINQVANNEPLDLQNAVLDEIRSVSQLLYDQLSLYIYSELDYYEQLNAQIQVRVNRLIAYNFIVLGTLVLMLAGTLYTISNSITRPIDHLIENTKKLAEGDFGVHIENDNRNEITALNKSFNSMVKKLRILMDTVKEDAREREKLELRLMQEQINPHFLYNTLETIIWMAESGDREKIIKIVQSLSKFFRMVLSEGKDIVTVQEELSYIESYLLIQKTRYSDIMDYVIEASEDVLNCRIQKLSLQPLVENALYHGIKNKRAFGIIRVTARRDREDLILSVSDDGCGMSEERLSELHRAIEQKKNLSGGNFGLSNLQKRIQLYYGEDYGVTIDSRPGEGTVATLHIYDKTEGTLSENK